MPYGSIVRMLSSGSFTQLASSWSLPRTRAGPFDHVLEAGRKMIVVPERLGNTGDTSTLPLATIFEPESMKSWFEAGSVVQVLPTGSYASAVIDPVPYSPPATRTRPSRRTSEE